MIQVLGGTPVHGEDLCATCCNATIRKGMSLSQYAKRCDAFEEPVTYAVASCTAYRDTRLARPDAFYKTGWVIVPVQTRDKQGRVTEERFEGIPPTEYHRRARKGEVDY